MTNNNGRIKVEMSQAEFRMYKSLKTLEGQRMLKIKLARVVVVLRRNGQIRIRGFASRDEYLVIK